MGGIAELLLDFSKKYNIIALHLWVGTGAFRLTPQDLHFARSAKCKVQFAKCKVQLLPQNAKRFVIASAVSPTCVLTQDRTSKTWQSRLIKKVSAAPITLLTWILTSRKTATLFPPKKFWSNFSGPGRWLQVLLAQDDTNDLRSCIKLNFELWTLNFEKSQCDFLMANFV